MKRLKLIKVIASSLVVASVLVLNPISASAEWKRNSNGWWNTEGSSWSIGWKEIDGKWYYFGQDGYMEHDTIIDGYNIGSDGAWIKSAQNNLSNSGNDKNFTIDQFDRVLKTKGYTSEVKDVDKDFLSTTRKIITLGNEQLDIYIYNSNEEMEKDSLNIDKDGFGYSSTDAKGETTLTNVSWISYPHFYKRGNIIVQYVGKNEKIISNLKNILGEQFAGFKEHSDLSSSEKDIREIAFNQLDLETQKKIKSWKDGRSSIKTVNGGIRLYDESYRGKEAYCVEFTLDMPNNRVVYPNNMFVYIGIDNHKIIGYGLVD